MTVELKVDENFVSYVLDTYDLSDRTRERLEKTDKSSLGLKARPISTLSLMYISNPSKKCSNSSKFFCAPK